MGTVQVYHNCFDCGFKAWLSIGPTFFQTHLDQCHFYAKIIKILEKLRCISGPLWVEWACCHVQYLSPLANRPIIGPNSQ